MRRLAFFDVNETVVVNSEKCPDLNGPGLVVERMWIEGRNGSKDGWVYKIGSRLDGRWLQEGSLKKALKGCGLTFRQVLDSIQLLMVPGVDITVPILPNKFETAWPNFSKTKAIMDEIHRRNLRRQRGDSDGAV